MDGHPTSRWPWKLYVEDGRATNQSGPLNDHHMEENNLARLRNCYLSKQEKDFRLIVPLCVLTFLFYGGLAYPNVPWKEKAELSK